MLYNDLYSKMSSWVVMSNVTKELFTAVFRLIDLWAHMRIVLDVPSSFQPAASQHTLEAKV